MADTATTTQTDASSTTDTTTVDATGQQQNGGTDERRFTQAELDAVVRDRLEREKKQSERATAKAREEAEAKALADQAEWKTLAERRAEQLTAAESKAAEVETVQAKADRYEAALKTHLDAQRKDLPAHILALLDKLDPVEQIEWIAGNREALAKPQSGVPATPKSGDRSALTEAEQQAQRAAFGTQVSRMFR